MDANLHPISVTPLDGDGAWRPDLVVPSQAIQERIEDQFPLVPAPSDEGASPPGPSSEGYVAPANESSGGNWDPQCRAKATVFLLDDDRFRIGSGRVEEREEVGRIEARLLDGSVRGLVV